MISYHYYSDFLFHIEFAPSLLGDHIPSTVKQICLTLRLLGSPVATFARRRRHCQLSPTSNRGASLPGFGNKRTDYVGLRTLARMTVKAYLQNRENLEDTAHEREPKLRRNLRPHHGDRHKVYQERTS